MPKLLPALFALPLIVTIATPAAAAVRTVESARAEATRKLAVDCYQRNSNLGTVMSGADVWVACKRWASRQLRARRLPPSLPLPATVDGEPHQHDRGGEGQDRSQRREHVAMYP